MKYPLVELQRRVCEFLAVKFGKADAGRITEYLIWAEKSGNSTQGLIKLSGSEPLQSIQPKGPITVERETKLSQLIDAGGHPAPLVCQIGTDAAIGKAKQHGFGIVAVRNTFSSNGAQAFYVERMANQDLIGIAMSRCPGSVAAFNSIDPIFGTNPIGIAFPTMEQPLVFDMATSAMTWYGLVLAKARGDKIPLNMAIDSTGHPTCDPSEAMKGALLPFDRSYKGSGLGLVVEVLAGPLAASAYCDFKSFDQEWGSILVALDPGLLVDPLSFKRNCSELIRLIRSSRPANGAEAIRLPGDRSQAKWQEAELSGVVEIDDAVLKALPFLASD